MLYNAPFGSTDPNASFVDGDPINGVEGSIPPAAQMEQPQREIVNAIAAAGFTPSAADLTQLLQAVRSGCLNFFQDQSIAANAIVLTPAKAYTALFPGMILRFKANFAPTGDSVAQVNSIAGIGIRKSGGSKLAGGEWAVGDMVMLEYDGTYLQLRGGGGSGGLLVTSNITLNVPSALYPTIRSAVQAASALFLPLGVYGQIVVAANYVEYLTPLTGPIELPGQFGDRWSIVGAPLLGAYPTATDIAGKTNAQVLSLLRTRFQVEVRCVGTGAFKIRSGIWTQIANILVTGDGTASGGFYGIKVGDWSTNVGMAALGLLNVWAHNFGLDNIRAEQTSVIQAINVGSTYATAHDFHLSHYSVLECNTGNLLGMYGNQGVALQNGGQLAVDSSSGTIDLSYNQVAGIAALQGGWCNIQPATAVRIQNNQYGLYFNFFCSAGLPGIGSTAFQGNAQDILMAEVSQVVTSGCALPGGSSPARGATSTDGSHVY